MFEAYFDESGIHQGAEICVVGGFYGTHAAWRRFENQWNKIIDDYPELAGEGFHAKVFFDRASGKRVGPYKTWDDAKATKFLDRLVQTIMRNRIFPIGYAIVVQHFSDLPQKTREWFTGAKFTINGKRISSGSPKRSYYVPFQFSVLEAAKASGTKEKIHFFVGLDRSFSEYADGLYKYLLEDSARIPDLYRSVLGSINFPLAKETPGLQAADLLSYRLYRYAQDILAAIEMRKRIPLPPLLQRILKNKKPHQRFDLLDGPRLRRISKDAQAMAAELIPTLGARAGIMPAAYGARQRILG
jgi:hypothetical protein